jgi:asparagine synthase (glutamine-hydrolysing)
MLYGVFSPRSLVNEGANLNRLKKSIEWAEGEHHNVNYKNFSGGFFLDPRLPYTVDDCLYIDTSHDLLVLMTGCLYNRVELCSQFNLNFSRLSEPALVAQIYLQEGPNFVNSLNGDFTIVIYESPKNVFYLFRDHLGITPLAYTTTEQSIYFASDIIGLCRTFSEGIRINMDPFIADYKVVDMTLTPNEKVLKLKAGHSLSYTTEGVTTKKYWEPERIKTDKTLSQEQMFSELKSLLKDAVHIRADQRFNAGAHVSGGLDSSFVAVLARKEFEQQSTFYGYSWSPSNSIPVNNELDERVLVKQTCEMAGITPVHIHVEINDFVELTKNSMNSFMYFHEEKVLEMAKTHKTNLLFNGHGGDEFISYGSLGVDSDLLFNFQWKTFLKKNPLSHPKKIIKYLVFRVLFPAINYIPFSVKKSYDEALWLFKKSYRKLHRKTYKRYYCYRSRRKYQLGLLYNYHLPERTECWAITGYKAGIQYRYPLLDKRIVEYILKVPSKLLVKDSKYTRIILREISEGLLPDAVRWRLGKKDPAFFALVNSQTKDRGLLFINEIDDFKANPSLYFVDFSLVEREIKQYKEDDKYPSPNKLLGDILAFKALHELSKSYEKSIEE